jgi:hypothetical protein
MSEPTEREAERETEWQRKRRLAAVFGDVLPDTTSDEREQGAPSDGDPSEEWLKAQVPPHHGGS